MTTHAATTGTTGTIGTNEIKNAIADQLLIEKYHKLEASRKAAVVKYYKNKWHPDKDTMTPEELNEYDTRRNERNEKARQRYYTNQAQNKQRSKDRYYRLKKEAEENKIKLENLKDNESN